MKAIILAAGNNSGIKKSSVPTCLMEVDGKSLLERQINILAECGVEEYVVVIGAQGNCWNEQTYNAIYKITSKVLVNKKNAETPSTSSIAIGLSYFSPDNILLIDGDTIFEKVIIQEIINHSSGNVVLAQEKYKKGGRKIILKGNRVLSFGKTKSDNLVYAGIMKLQKDLYKKLLNVFTNQLIYKKEYVLVLNVLLKKHEVTALPLNYVRGGVGDILDLKPLVGGSYATTRVITKMIKEPIKIVHKEAAGEGRSKLIDEITWISDLPTDLKPYFPQLIDYDIKSKLVWAEMKYYPLPTLRDLLITQKIDSEKAVYILKNLIDFMFSRVYNLKKSDKTKDYAKRIHINRIKNRLALSAKRSQIIEKIITAQYVHINGRKFYNLPLLISWLEKDDVLLNKLEPPFVSTVHGDLHFDNFLVDMDQFPMVKFILFDPRGLDSTYDYSYDLGKIWHSCHSKYDILHEGLFKLNHTFKEDTFHAKLAITDKKALQIYREVHKKFQKTLQQNSTLKKDKYWLMRTLFAEVGHLCSVVPFHIQGDEKEELAIALYLTGVKLLNDFMFNYAKNNFRKEIFRVRYANINTIKDF